MNTAVRFALIGCGRIGKRHAAIIQELGILTAVCDIDKAKADAFSAQYGVSAFYTLNDLLKNITDTDVVVIATPNGLHAVQTIAVMEQGMHVLCEKPMAITTHDCRRMLAASERSGKNLFVVKQNRFNPPVVAVREWMDQGRLGKIYSVQLNCFWNRDEAYYQNSWKGTLDMDGGILFTQFSHFIDLLYWFVGDIESVSAHTANFHHRGIIEFEDSGVVNLKFRNGAIGTLHFTVNAFKKNMEGSMTLFAEKGTVKIGGQYLNELEYQSLEGAPIPELPAGNPANDYGTYSGSMSNHDKVYRQLIDELNGGDVKATSGKDGLKTVEIIERIYQDAKKSLH